MVLLVPRVISMAASLVSTRNDGFAPTVYDFDQSWATADRASKGRAKERTRMSLRTSSSTLLYVKELVSVPCERRVQLALPGDMPSWRRGSPTCPRSIAPCKKIDGRPGKWLAGVPTAGRASTTFIYSKLE